MDADPIASEAATSELQPHRNEGNLRRVDVQYKQEIVVRPFDAVRTKTVTQPRPECAYERELSVGQSLTFKVKPRQIVHDAPP
ncbi:hypothetical protein ASE68_12470 [Agromyces sp. Leaf222]|nr:hypothetical protein ASE68_12470 [Agromyces sp. Leaf222]